jgi:hypothetical protein
MSAVFYQNDTQRELAIKTRDREAARRGTPVTTAILPLTAFYLAEDYHQKYVLRSRSDLMREFRGMYPEDADFVNSTAAARVNSYLAGHGTPAQFDKEIDLLGLSEEGRVRLRKYR